MKGLKKTRRIQIIVLAFALAIGSAALIGYAMRDGINFFRAPAQVISEPPEAGEVFRLGGLVEKGSLVRGQGETITFRVTDGAETVPVAFTGVLPDLFSEGQGMIGTGQAYPQTAEARSAKRNSIRGMIFRRFSRLIAVNDAIADVFLRFGVPADDILIILPYSLKMPDPSVAVPKELKDFFDSHSPVLLAVGGLEPDYDPLFQIAAMKEILTEFPNAGLMIVGDGSMRAEVEAAIHDSGYSESIFLSGNVEHEVTLHLINDADVLLRTTLFDGDAISVREALHLGTPVIATDSSMRPDGVRLIRSGDRNGLTEAASFGCKI